MIYTLSVPCDWQASLRGRYVFIRLLIISVSKAAMIILEWSSLNELPPIRSNGLYEWMYHS